MSYRYSGLGAIRITPPVRTGNGGGGSPPTPPAAPAAQSGGWTPTPVDKVVQLAYAMQDDVDTVGMLQTNPAFVSAYNAYVAQHGIPPKIHNYTGSNPLGIVGIVTAPPTVPHVVVGQTAPLTAAEIAATNLALTPGNTQLIKPGVLVTASGSTTISADTPGASQLLALAPKAVWSPPPGPPVAPPPAVLHPPVISVSSAPPGAGSIVSTPAPAVPPSAIFLVSPAPVVSAPPVPTDTTTSTIDPTTAWADLNAPDTADLPASSYASDTFAPVPTSSPLSTVETYASETFLGLPLWAWAAGVGVWLVMRRKRTR